MTALETHVTTSCSLCGKLGPQRQLALPAIGPA